MSLSRSFSSRVLSGALCFLGLAGAAVAQTGTYTVFGKGCPGSTGSGPGCLNANLTGTWGGNSGVNLFALAVNSGTVPRLICAFEFYAASSSGPITKNAWIYDSDAAGKPNAILATTTIAWDATPQRYRATLARPLLIAANTRFHLAFENPGRLPYMTAGPDTVQHYHSGPSWAGPFNARWNYNILCCGQASGAVPQIGNSGLPSISQPFKVTLASALPNSAAIIILGLSNTTWGPIPLPLALDGAGAPGCALLVSFDAAGGLPTDGTGASAATFTFPNDAKLIGILFHNQWAVVDVKANVLGLAFSDGGTGKIGS